MSGAHQLQVSGRIRISEANRPFRGGVAHITLEETGRSDVAAPVVAEHVVEGVDHSAGRDTEVPFRFERLDSAAIDQRKEYSVRVWIDTDASGAASENDLFSYGTHRVLTKGTDGSVTVEL